MALVNFAPKSLKSSVKKIVSVVKKSPPKPKISTEELEKMIRVKSYELYEQRGCASGSEVEDWVRAENMIKSQYEH